MGEALEDLAAALAAGDPAGVRSAATVADLEGALQLLAAAAAGGSSIAVEVLLERLDEAGVARRMVRAALLEESAVDDVTQDVLISAAAGIVGRVFGGVRSSFGVSRAAVDVRRAVRPLSAPHRTGVRTLPLGDLDGALAGLEGLFGPAPAPPAELGRSPAPRRRDRRGAVVALTPRRHRAQRRALPRPWQVFLETGVRPRLREPAPDAPAHTRSTWEAIATATMLRAGWSAEESWAAIVAGASAGDGSRPRGSGALDAVGVEPGGGRR